MGFVSLTASLKVCFPCELYELVYGNAQEFPTLSYWQVVPASGHEP